MNSVLDAWAAVAFLQDEPSALRVERALERGALISDVNLGEALYIMARRQGFGAAMGAIGEFRGTLDSEAPDWELTRRAAMVKASGTLSYADAFAVATAQRHSVPLLTGDPEIIALDHSIEVVDLREEAE